MSKEDYLKTVNSDNVFKIMQNLNKQKELETKLVKKLANQDDISFEENKQFQEIELNENNIIQAMEEEIMKEFGLHSASYNAFQMLSSARIKLSQALKEPNFYHFSEKIIKYACDYLDRQCDYQWIMDLKHQYNERIAKQNANETLNNTNDKPISDDVFNDFLKKFEDVPELEEIIEETNEEIG